MNFFAELMNQILDHVPSLSLECFLFFRQYIQALYGSPMPEDSLTLFLIDPSRGDLTRGAEGLCAQHLRSGTRQLSARRLGSDGVQSDAER